MKRLLDVAAAAVLLVLSGLVILVLAILIRWRMGSPVLFRQERPGRAGRRFMLLKFRTMREAVDAGGKALPDGQRMTRLGRFLRGTSLDELPQLLNVLAGRMSLVGPRPLLVQYLPLYNQRQGRRHEVRPGITGWAQINGRNAITWEEKFELDVWYIENWSLWLDIRILFRTFWNVIRPKDISAADHATMPPFTGSPTAVDADDG